MTITPATDIVLGVTRAADPTKHEAAVQRLRRIGSEAVGDTTVFKPVKSTVQPAISTMPALPPAVQPASAMPRILTDKSAHDAFRKLEAFVLQTFVQAMLPKNATMTYGKGAAGDIWKSMMAEKLGAQLAGSDQIGLATRLAAAAILPGRAGSVVSGNEKSLVRASAVPSGASPGLAPPAPQLNLVGT